jgi:hypothetical protein
MPVKKGLPVPVRFIPKAENLVFSIRKHIISIVLSVKTAVMSLPS